jgi:hypothetical protein
MKQQNIVLSNPNFRDKAFLCSTETGISVESIEQSKNPSQAPASKHVECNRNRLSVMPHENSSGISRSLQSQLIKLCQGFPGAVWSVARPTNIASNQISSGDFRRTATSDEDCGLTIDPRWKLLARSWGNAGWQNLAISRTNGVAKHKTRNFYPPEKKGSKRSCITQTVGYPP